MSRKPSPRTLAAASLLFSAALSVALLAVRNLYDDEISSLDIVTSSVAKILYVSAEGDVHPPGMYLLAHVAYRILPSFRWMDLFPGLMLYAGLAFFLLQVAPLFARTRAQLCLLLLATLHPQLLMWSATYRWYGWWTGLALIALTVALQPNASRPSLSLTRALLLAILLTGLFFLSYITFLFALALAAAMLLRYRRQPRKRLFGRALLIAGVFLVLIAPQLHTMLAVHLPLGRAQHYGVAISTLRLLQSISVSEAYLPWHPLAILADLVFAGLCIFGLIALRRLYSNSRTRQVPPATLSDEFNNALASILLFGLTFFVLVAASGLGGKPRNGLLLIPILAPAAALLVQTLRPRAQTAVLLFFALWSAVGIAHLLGRYGLTKATMNDRPEQVVAFIQRTTGPGCSVVVTYDITLAFSVAHANPPRTMIVSPFRGDLFGGSRSLPANGCDHPRLFAVQSYLGGMASRADIYNTELRIAAQSIDGPPSVDSFSPDLDAGRKRSLSRLRGFGDLTSLARLPDSRYVVLSGPIDPTAIEPMRRRMPHFASGYVISPAAEVSTP